MDKIITILRKLAAAIILLITIVLPIGVINPFTAGDYMVAGAKPPFNLTYMQ